MLIKLLLVLLFSTLLNLERENRENKPLTIDKNLQIKVAKPSLIEDIKKENTKDLLGTLSIKKINLLNKPIYNLKSSKNNIEKNITILKESIFSQNSSIIILAAHSGNGEFAYFKNLHKLKINDLIIFHHHDEDYTYQIKDIYEQNKNGSIHINKKYQHELILTTCSKNKNKQLIIECDLK